MRQRRKESLILLIIILVLSLGIGYAFLTTTLNIDGTADVDSNTWNVYWDNVQVTSGSVTGNQVITQPTISNQTTVSFHIRLKEPGEYYEFTVDAKNTGGIDAMIETINKTVNNNTTIPNYLSYSVTYADDIEIENNHLLAAGTTEKYKVKILYRTDINPSDLPTTAQSLKVSLNTNYIQRNENAVPVTRPESFATDSWDTIVGAVRSGNTDVYNVGDEREIYVTGLGNYHIRIINKSTPAECLTEGFSQTACGFVLEFKEPIADDLRMSAGLNLGGWPETSMRSNLNSEFINKLPEEIKNTIIDTYVVSSNNSISPQNPYEQYISTDKIYILSLCEFSLCDRRYFAEYDFIRVYDYYVNNSYRKYNASGQQVRFITRTGFSNNTSFYGSGGDGDGTRGFTATSYVPYAPIFRIG